MTITLITGANKGLGLQTARELLAAGHTVYLGARDAQRGQEVAASIGARPLLIDITDDASVQAAAAVVRAEEGHLDVLVNNAGIAGSGPTPRDVSGPDMVRTFDTNVFGIVRMMHAFLPLLEASTSPVVVNVSSGLGSFALTTDPDNIAAQFTLVAYSSSKAAVNMLTLQYARAFPGIRINAVDPGYTATDLNGHRGTQTVEQGAVAIVRMALIGADGPTGTLVDAAGVEPW
ncbi:SDR family NAD(P)-dependent oxidoreductase [Cellulomonas sp. P24]|uniref:SDR family NAD(P)-dependent oxidoreductase n=1 Tax=Cellulomonas sp. P24 TaxID=2885206 RepID=UPI00216AD5CD|nr:SDR family NAD(P)-dependent oxidoreductase [Cellulomonas sp. P24]MCR6492527.1 SDR family NAD(P)-dependent oxidoreductase [Cellulomonas sp. P24]